ncbi:MAG TPA: TonB-dependent receptor [Bryobacteraceae bacterium]|nr:TonB-dependent receptor [Bryobacteraceae bacterium]
MSNRLRLSLSLLCIAVSALVPVRAQVPVGSLNGMVHDQSGGLMQNVAVTVTNKNTGVERQVVTGTDGTFGVAPLAAGTYVVKATASGFRTMIQQATVQVGQSTMVDIVMQVGAATEVVSVQGEAAQIDYDTHTISGVIDRQQIENLPLNGRSFLNLAMLEPGVSVSANSVGQYNRLFDVNILGADSGNGSVRITVDGATIADSVTGGTQQNFSQEVVQEFQLSSTNMDLSNAIGAGGAVNIATRGGTNDFHGAAFFYFRDHNMSAYPYLQRVATEPASPFFARRQSGFDVGGPIVKDKLFFFSALEHTNQVGVFSAFPSDPLFQQFASYAASPFHENELNERLDWTINAKHTASLRYSHDGNNGYAPSGGGDLPSDWDVNTNWADSGVFALTSALSPTTANEFRYSYTYWSNTNNPPTASICPAPCIGLGMPNLSIYGVSNFTIGDATNAPQSRVLRRHIFSDNVSKMKGGHAMKFGAYWEYQKGIGTYAYAAPAAGVLYSPEIVQYFNSQVPPPFQLSIPSSFNSINDILQLPVAGFAMGVGDINQPPLWNRGNADHDNTFHFFWQDNWRVKPRFSLNYGLAWTYESNALNFDLTKPDYLAPVYGSGNLGNELHSPHDFSPMLGFAWTVDKQNKTVIRGGVGVYYDTINIEVRLIERAMLGPAGTGRALLGDSVFFPTIAQINDFGALPPPLQPSALSSQPTTFTGAELVSLIPTFYAGAQAELGPPGNTSLAIRNINVFKTGTEMLAHNFRPPYSEHASIGIQREIRSDFVVTADFVFRQYLHQMIRDTDLNHFYSAAGPVIPACQGAQALDPTAECSTGVIQGIISGARSHYKGLLLKANKRFSHRTAGQLSYAYASQVGYNGLVDDSNWFASWGPQAGHQILTGSFIVDLPWGFQISGIESFSSVGPIEPSISGVDLNGNGAVAAGETGGSPLPGIGYNEFNVSAGKAQLIQLVNQFNQTYAGKSTTTGTIPTIALPSTWSFPRSFNSQDVRVTKTFNLGTERLKLKLIGECFNIFNIANLGGYSYNLTSEGAGFGVPTSRDSNIFGSGGPRAFQLAGRFEF